MAGARTSHCQNDWLHCIADLTAPNCRQDADFAAMYTTSELCEVVTTEVQAMVSQAKVVDDSDWRKELPKWTVFRTVFKRTYSF